MIKSLWPPSLSSTLGRATGATAATTKRHAERRILRTDPRHLYQIILDVDSYRHFLPLCTSSKILRRSECGTMFDASLGVGLPPPLSPFPGGEYVSRVTTGTVLEGAGGGGNEVRVWTVDARSVRGDMFDSLASSWRLRAVAPAADGDYESEDSSAPSSSSPLLRVDEANGIGIGGGSGSGTTTTTAATARTTDTWWTDVDFSVEMTVSDPLVSSVLDKVLEGVAGRQVEAFERRCREVPFRL